MACSIDAPQLPQNLSPTYTLPRQLGQVRAAAVGAALMGVTVALVGAAVLAAVDVSLDSSPPVAFSTLASANGMAAWHRRKKPSSPSPGS